MCVCTSVAFFLLTCFSRQSFPVLHTRHSAFSTSNGLRRGGEEEGRKKEGGRGKKGMEGGGGRRGWRGEGEEEDGGGRGKKGMEGGELLQR